MWILGARKGVAGFAAENNELSPALIDIMNDRPRSAQCDGGKLRQCGIQRPVGSGALCRDLGHVGIVAWRRDIESMRDGAAFEAEALYRGEQIVRYIDDGRDALRLAFIVKSTHRIDREDDHKRH